MKPTDRESSRDLLALLQGELVAGPNDLELDRGAVERALAACHVVPLARTRRRTVWLWMAAALFGTAVAWALPRIMRRSNRAEHITQAAGVQRRSPPVTPVPGPTASIPQMEIARPVSEAPIAGSSGVARGLPQSELPASERLDSASQLFQRAGALRREGARTEALGVYQDLQSRFGASPEARLSFVIVGRLLLQGGKNAAALAQFDQYLVSDGQAAEDAIVGRATALEALGRATEERQAWQRLLGAFPDSVHAARARERLQALDASIVAPAIP